ncbi:MAG: esterase-like activity of phytase family protein [Verrucomicrobiota bacterium]
MRAFLVIFFLVPVFHLTAGTVIEASGELPADGRDEHGDTIGGIGSGLVYDAGADVFYSLSDRGPGDGALPYRPRWVVLKIAQAGDKLDIAVVRSVILRDEQGHDMTGQIPDDQAAAVPRMKDGRTCIDPEALALASDGSLYITDEYGPYLYQFAADGKMIRRLEMPEAFRPRTAEGSLDFSDHAALVSGRNINQGPEGMCLMPDGKTAALIFQSGLIQEGGRESPTTRLIVLDLATGNPTGIFVYPFTPEVPGMEQPVKIKNLSVNDLTVLSDGRFLVLERDQYGRDGSSDPKPARYKAVWVVDTSCATNLRTDQKQAPRAVEKKLLFNLPDLVKDTAGLAAKWESLALVPPVSGGAVTLIMAADNDFLTPVIHHAGVQYPFPRVRDSVPLQFFKIHAALPENP